MSDLASAIRNVAQPTLRAFWIDRQKHDPMIQALAARMVSDPKLACEAVTGRCHWPPEEGVQIGSLAVEASNAAFDLIDHVAAGQFVPALRGAATFRIEQLLAAEVALCELEARDEEAHRERERTLEEMSCAFPGRGWQRIFR